jgi:hypothetical protein
MSLERYFVDSVVRGFHIYKNIWNPAIGELLLCEKEFGNLHDPYAVAVVRSNGVIVGHIPRRISCFCYFFLCKNGIISCVITGKRRYSTDLPQGGLEVPCTLTFVGQSPEIQKVRRLLGLAPSKSIDPPPIKRSKVEVILEEEDDDDIENPTDIEWVKFRGHLLTESDKKAIASDELLNDRHINYAQTLLHHHFPSVEGLYNTLYQRKIKKKIICGIQIIHDRGNHWVVASTINSDNSVQVYDSLYATLNDETADVIKNIFEVTDEMTIEVKKMQTQHGSKDCGLFAIATSTALLNGLDVSQITFRQEEMRTHLISCLTVNSLTPFPIF